MKMEASAKGDSDAKRPVHEQVYQRLRRQIMFGDLAPGQAVTIQGLAEALGAGMTPVREAIRRLISEGALRFQGNRRVSVPVMSESDVLEMIYIRKAIEPELCRRAAANLTAARIDGLSRIDQALDDAISAGDVPAYLHNNHLFHFRLYDLAAAPVMAEMTDRLWLRFGPSLRVVCGRFGTQNLRDFHKDILRALRRGDADAAAAAMALDVEQGMLQVIEVLGAQNPAN